MSYLARLKVMIAEQAPKAIDSPNTPTVSTDKTDRRAFVGFVGTSGRNIQEKNRPNQEPTKLTEGVSNFEAGDNYQVYEPQADPNRCHVCGERETVDLLFIAVLTSELGTHHWLHHDCHDEHIRRCAARRGA